MINRTNEFVYVKRHYFFPFKPLMDWEYKKFGYKKCDKDKGKDGIFNTAYYVRHKERPMGLYDMLYYINLPFSFFRAILCPFLLAVLLLSMLIEGTIGSFVQMDLLLAEQALILILVFPAMLVSTVLGNFGYNLYRKNDTNGKLDRIMKSRGWPAWTSYHDNDPRFTPPCSKSSSPKEYSAPQKSRNTSQNSIDKNIVKANTTNNTTNTNTDDVITLMTANGEEVCFTKIAVIVNDGILYAILQPVELLEGMDDDEALVFRVSKTVNGSESFEIETDDEIVDTVFAEYDRLYEESH